MPKTSGKKMRILAIETSCDETSVALLSVDKNNVKVLHHETATQIPIHQRYGGVVPEVAARMHVAELVSLLDRSGVFGRGGPMCPPSVMSAGRPRRTHRSAPTFDAIAVTRGPGLATALRVGIEAARTIVFVTGKPLVGVNHLEGHLASAWLVPENRKRWKFPVLALLVSGGHTELVLMKDFCSYKVVGRTRDDASGEAFDKTAKLMGLGYPGGPVMSKLAEKGNPKAFDIPRPMMHDKSLDFSFSGLKTAVRNIWEKLPAKKRKDDRVIADLCASVQQAIVEVLVAKTIRAIKKYKPTAVCIVGGVSANTHLQSSLRESVHRDCEGVTVLAPAAGFHTDNAAMIGMAGAWRLKKKKADNWKTIDAEPELDL